MPDALNHEAQLSRPTKRRKLSSEQSMAAFEETDPDKEHSFKRAMTEPRGRVSPPSHRSRACGNTEIRISDREQLIESIKRGENPKWTPKPSLKALYDEEQSSLSEVSDTRKLLEKDTSEPPARRTLDEDLFFGPWTEASHDDPISQSQLLGAPYEDPFGVIDPFDDPTSSILNRESSTSGTGNERRTPGPRWRPSMGPPSIERFISDPRALEGSSISTIDTNPHRAYSVGSSRSSSFVMRTPTSPLAHGSIRVDTMAEDGSTLAEDHDRTNRRRTMPPDFLHSPLGTSPDARPTGLANYSSLRQQSTSYQAHQPRRSLGSFSYQASYSPLTSQSRPHRPCLGSDSARRRSSLVGSFEESILKGRMSSPASRPFEFIAQVGVMGKGDCPAILRCPPHAVVPFEAVFYNYPTSSHSRSISDDAPSPYVGLVDLEQNLKPVQFKLKTSSSATPQHTAAGFDPVAPENTSIGLAIAREAAKHKRTVSTSTVNLGGAYRVPQQGQLQVVIKNSNKIAVKLFLIPYDLEGMGTGTKTFVRQRSYMTGPIMDDIVTSSQSDNKIVDPLKDKRILRYLIHVKFCCPAKGRYYLYDNIRVVFANRVPDGREKLHNELQLPEPTYSPYHPAKVPSNPSRSSMSDDPLLDANFNMTPTFFGGSFVSSSPIVVQGSDLAAGDRVKIPFHLSSRETTIKPVKSAVIEADDPGPFRFPDLPAKTQTQEQEPQRALSPVQGFLPSTSARASLIMWRGNSDTPMLRSFSPQPVEAGNGLLSRQFKKLNETGDAGQQKTD